MAKIRNICSSRQTTHYVIYKVCSSEKITVCLKVLKRLPKQHIQIMVRRYSLFVGQHIFIDERVKSRRAITGIYPFTIYGIQGRRKIIGFCIAVIQPYTGFKIQPPNNMENQLLLGHQPGPFYFVFHIDGLGKGAYLTLLIEMYQISGDRVIGTIDRDSPKVSQNNTTLSS